MMRNHFIIGLVATAGLAGAIAAQPGEKLRAVTIIATGGTIAGEAASSVQA
jgi:L-asparaginase/Glu-tRNA(Gln) amidotransferase subunit D